MTHDFNPPLIIGVDDYEFMVWYPTAGSHIEVRISPRSTFGTAEIIAALRHVIDTITGSEDAQ